jgi:cobalt-zinc-cadmium efflux system outer membrane protein
VGVLLGGATRPAVAQAALTWSEVRARCKAANPNLRAGELGIEESRAEEISAFLPPNPQVTLSVDQINFVHNSDGPALFANALTVGSAGYLFELGGKRVLRKESAEGATAIAISGQADLERNILYSARGAFLQVLQAKAFLKLANEEVADYDKFLVVSRDRRAKGDIAQIDLDRLELQRAQYETDLQTAIVNLRTAKIQLLALMNDRSTPTEQFDVSGEYDLAKPSEKLDKFHEVALQTRPDLKAALQSIDKAGTDHRLAEANATWDPTVGFDVGGLPAGGSSSTYFGLNLSLPLRVFDRNQGETLRTKIDITRNEQLAEASRTQVFSDVDSAYASMMSNVALLESYKSSYLAQSVRVRDTIMFSYSRGGASLLDLLQALQDYRSVQIAYVNLIAAGLQAVAQVNFSVGQEVIQ